MYSSMSWSHPWALASLASLQVCSQALVSLSMLKHAHWNAAASHTQQRTDADRLACCSTCTSRMVLFCSQLAHSICEQHGQSSECNAAATLHLLCEHARLASSRADNSYTAACEQSQTSALFWQQCYSSAYGTRLLACLHVLVSQRLWLSRCTNHDLVRTMMYVNFRQMGRHMSCTLHTVGHGLAHCWSWPWTWTFLLCQILKCMDEHQAGCTVWHHQEAYLLVKLSMQSVRQALAFAK